MSFNNELPEWQAQGTEPPQSLKENGWQAGVKPPADYFNWLQYKVYKALQELQQHAIHKGEKGKSNGVATLNDEGKVPSEQIDIDIDTSDLAKKQDFENLKSDYMYQIPTIVDAQIRINRLSNTNRLFFKLENNLEGNITISTDGGTTEKPLVDVDENPITQLEKGFSEVVADANFFILRNRGISQADKQALIDIVNEAEANESDLKTQFIDTVNNKTGSTLPVDATWFDVKNAISNMTNRKWRSEISEKTMTAFSVTGLDFKPSIVVVQHEDYVGDTNNRRGAYIGINSDVFSLGYHTSSSNTTATSPPPVVDYGTFSISSNNVPNGIVHWLAIE